MTKKILWWGRFDPSYSRNAILRKQLTRAGYHLADFRPRSSFLGGLESLIRKPVVPDAVWVPAFRQRDFISARSFARKHSIPLIFDPLISSWDKVVFERKKCESQSGTARRLHRAESSMFTSSDIILADTELHRDFFIHEMSAPAEKTFVVPVGADEELFSPSEKHNEKGAIEILFYGSFISLQSPETIVRAARLVPEVNWTLLGEGPLKKTCEQLAGEAGNITFEGWCPYEQLSHRIGQADILLGVFGGSRKAGRVIPNKVYQSLAAGRPVITRHSLAYPAGLGKADAGITFIGDEDSEALAGAVRQHLREPVKLALLGENARQTYERFFSIEVVKSSLFSALRSCHL